jgi:hypothetical protein
MKIIVAHLDINDVCMYLGKVQCYYLHLRKIIVLLTGARGTDLPPSPFFEHSFHISVQ